MGFVATVKYPRIVYDPGTEGGGAHNNLQPYIVMHWIIKT
jgi:hypothetical protein